jgi:hypothetical protein
MDEKAPGAPPVAGGRRRDRGMIAKSGFRLSEKITLRQQPGAG